MTTLWKPVFVKTSLHRYHSLNSTWKTVFENRVVPSCPLFCSYVFLKQGSNNQPDRSAVSPDIHTQCFFDIRLYQEDRLTGVPVVPTLPWSCSPDKSFVLSARHICCFPRYNDSNFFSKIVCIKSTARRCVSQCTSSKVMFSWYKVWIFRKINLPVIKIFRIKIFSRIIIIRRTA